MNLKNTLIALTGIDGAGKTTQAKKLEKKLRINTISWKNFPPYSKLNGIHPSEYINSIEITERLELLNYYLDIEQEYLTKVKNNYLTIVDSTYVKFFIKEQIFNSIDIKTLNQFDYNNIFNVHYIYIKTPPFAALNRKNNKFTPYESFRKAQKDFVSFQNKQEALLDKFISRKENHLVINGLQDQNTIFDIIISYLFYHNMI